MIALQGQPQEASLKKLIAAVPEDIHSDASELDRIMSDLRKKQRQQHKEQLLARASSDPAAYEEYKQLMAQEAALR
jgi:uncharacterized membrane protein YebE (DUF533 family)